MIHRDSFVTNTKARSVDLFAFILEGHNPSKGAASSPDSAPQTGQLHNLRVVYEQIRASTLVLDVVRKHIGLCSFKPGMGIRSISVSVSSLR